MIGEDHVRRSVTQRRNVVDQCFQRNWHVWRLVTGEESMSHSPDTRCFGSVGVGPDDRFYTRCDACGWRGAVYEADQHDAARREVDGHTDPEVLRELAEWVELCRPKETYPRYPEETPWPDVQSEDTNS